MFEFKTGVFWPACYSWEWALFWIFFSKRSFFHFECSFWKSFCFENKPISFQNNCFKIFILWFKFSFLESVQSGLLCICSSNLTNVDYTTWNLPKIQILFKIERNKVLWIIEFNTGCPTATKHDGWWIVLNVFSTIC